MAPVSIVSLPCSSCDPRQGWVGAVCDPMLSAHGPRQPLAMDAAPYTFPEQTKENTFGGPLLQGLKKQACLERGREL